MTYTINEGLLPKLEGRLGVLKSKLAKSSKGKGTLTYAKSEPYIKGNEFVVDVDIDATYKLGEYEFIASLQYDPTTKQNLVKKASEDIEVPKMYRDRNICDHCKSNRHRVHTVLLRNVDTGEYIQVGKGCLKEFVGIDLSGYASYLSCFKSIDEYVEEIEKSTPSFYRQTAYKVKNILLQTLEYVARFGYCSKQQAFDCDCDSTSRCVWCAINHTACGEEIYDEFPISEDSKDKLLEVLDYLSQSPDDSDYVNNLRILAQNEYVKADNFGLVVSLIGWYLRDKYKVEERKAQKKKPSEYLGKAGERITITATPECIYEYDTAYGLCYIYRFNVDGNIAIWKTSKGLDAEEITVKGTIKSTQTYNGIKQTELTRCRIQ